MEKDLLEEKLQELRKKQEKISRVWRKTGNKELLQFFVDTMPKVLSAERCSIFILDPENKNVWLQCGTRLTEKQVTVPKHDSLVGRVISTGECEFETDMDTLVGSHGVVDMQTGFVTRSALCVPVHGITQDKVTGAIQVLNKLGGKSFGDEDRIILERLSRLLQLNIENIYLRQELAIISSEMNAKIALLEESLR